MMGHEDSLETRPEDYDVLADKPRRIAGGVSHSSLRTDAFLQLEQPVIRTNC
jgi:hypothetical protein